MPETRAFVFTAPAACARARLAADHSQALSKTSGLAASLSGANAQSSCGRVARSQSGRCRRRCAPRAPRASSSGSDEGKLSTAPARPPVAGPMLEQVGEAASPPSSGIRLTIGLILLLLALLLLLVVLAFVYLGALAGAAVTVIAIAAAAWLIREALRERGQAGIAAALDIAKLTPAAVNDAVIPDGFRITEPGTPEGTTAPPPDPVPAARFRQELARLPASLRQRSRRRCRA